MSNANDFQISKDVLIKYKGTENTVEFPEGVHSVKIGAFPGNVKHILFPESMTQIPDDVCYCLGTLESVTIPEGITRIGNRAFFTCTALKEVTLPESLRETGYAAFADCKALQSVRLPKGLQKIEGRTFSQCISLENVSIPSDVTELGNEAFNGCRLLTEVRIPDGITNLANGVFAGCRALRSVSLPANLTSIGTACFGACEHLENIVIPASVKVIEDRAFGGCGALAEVVLPEGLESVGEKAFFGCSKTLKLHCSAKIFGMLDKETKDNLTKTWLTGYAEYSKEQTDAIRKYAGRIRDRLFTEIEDDDETAAARLLTCGKVNPETLDSYIRKCNDGAHPKMMAVLLNYQNKTVSAKKKEEITDKAMGLAEKSVKDWEKIYRWTEEDGGIVLTKYKGIDAEVEIPDQIDGKPIVKIGKNAFKGNAQVQKIRMPNTVAEILDSAFEKCEALADIQWSENLRAVEKRAFCGCGKLTGTLTLPPNVKSLGVNAFSGCDYTEIELPEGLEFIAAGALTCGDYAQLHIPASVKEMGFCTGYFAGDLYIHGLHTKFKPNDFRGMPTVVHAPAGSYAAKCAEDGAFEEFVVI